MTDLEKLPKDVQVQIRTAAIVLALKNTLISTPELQEIFNKNFENEIKKMDLSKFSEADH